MPISFPSQAPKTERLILNRKQSATESNYNYAVQIVQTASQWMLEWSWPQVDHVRAEALAAWLLSLKGQIGTFTYAPRQAFVSTLTGRVSSGTSYAYNTSLVTGGWNPNAASGLRAGQYLSIGNQLLRIVNASAQASEYGFVTVTFEPELRVNYPNGTPLNFTNPTGLFRLASSDGTGYTLDPDKKPEFGIIQAREVVM